MKITVHRAPPQSPVVCAECGYVFSSLLSADKKRLVWTHYGTSYLKCSQVGATFSEPVVLEVFEVEAEMSLETET